ncbi:MAG TPA: class I SAM-dependent methyltransferase [bacterium]
MKKTDVIEYEKTRYTHLDQAIINFIEQRIVKRWIVKFELKGKEILDIPCGFGRFSGIFLNAGMRLTSGDLSFEMADRTRENSEILQRVSDFIVASVKALPFKKGSFDATFTARLLHHNFTKEERINILKELARISKKHIIVTLYKKNFLHFITRRLRRLNRVIVMLSMKEMESEIEASGLKIIEKTVILPVFHSQVFLVLEKKN